MYHPHIWELQPKSWKCSSHELVIVAVGNITARHIGKDSLVVGFFCFKLPGAKCQTAPWFFNTEKKGTCRRPTEAKSHKMSRLMISDHLLMIFGWFLGDLLSKNGLGTPGTPLLQEGKWCWRNAFRALRWSNQTWLVVSTPLKNMSQNGNLP